MGFVVSCMGSLRVQKHLAGQANHPAPVVTSLSEVFIDTPADAAGVAFILSRLPRNTAPILWIQDRVSRRDTGHLYMPGVWGKRPVITVNLSRPADVLWAMEDGLRCSALGAVIGEIWGAPGVLDFTATKRLAMRSETSATQCWLIRRGGGVDLSAARDRWRVMSRPSAVHPHDANAPGMPRWSLDLFRSRSSKPGAWVGCYDRTTDRLDFLATFRDGAVAKGDGASRQRAVG